MTQLEQILELLEQLQDRIQQLESQVERLEQKVPESSGRLGAQKAAYLRPINLGTVRALEWFQVVLAVIAAISSLVAEITFCTLTIELT